MRTVLSRIRSFNYTILNIRHHFIFNENGGEESEIAERQRESVFVREAHGRKEEVALVVKWIIEEMHLVRSM
jgi:hypothetical protein